MKNMVKKIQKIKTRKERMENNIIVIKSFQSIKTKVPLECPKCKKNYIIETEVKVPTFAQIMGLVVRKRFKHDTLIFRWRKDKEDDENLALAYIEKISRVFGMKQTEPKRIIGLTIPTQVNEGEKPIDFHYRQIELEADQKLREIGSKPSLIQY